jgi:hypothetical protein
MPVFIDARIPVVFAATPQPTDAILAAGRQHQVGCACCIVRGPAAAAFDDLFIGRVRGTLPWFTRVVVPTDDPAVRDTLTNDPVVSARFSLA